MSTGESAKMESLSLLCLFLCILSLSHAQSDYDAVMGEIGKLTGAISSQKTQLLSNFEAMKEEVKQEMVEVIRGVKEEVYAINNNTHKDLSTLKYLLDADECSDLTHNCSADATCIDTRVSYRCTCKEGFTGDGFTCQDINECQQKYRCGTYSVCKNVPGSYTCSCRDGFVGDGKICEDVNECDDGSHECHEYAECTNTIGSYKCTCSLYYKGNGFYCREEQIQGCNPPFKAVKGIGCIHIIERSQTFSISRQSCKELGGDLFVAINVEHYLRLAQYFIDTNQRSKKKYMWVGVKEGKWLSGRRVEALEEAPRNPDMSSGTCSYTDGDTSEMFLLWTDPCYETWWALCEKKN